MGLTHGPGRPLSNRITDDRFKFYNVYHSVCVLQARTHGLGCHRPAPLLLVVVLHPVSLPAAVMEAAATEAVTDIVMDVLTQVKEQAGRFLSIIAPKVTGKTDLLGVALL